jgi:integrase/recombinase XerD
MLNRVYCDAKVLERLRHTVLTTVPDELAEDLVRRGYSNRSIQSYSSAVGHFARWLEAERISPSLLSEHTTSLFLEHLPSCQCGVPSGGSIRCIRPALMHLLRILRESGRIPSKSPVSKRPVDEVVEPYVRYLREVRGVTSGTTGVYERQIHPFLEWKYGGGPIEITNLEVGDVFEFVLARSKHCHSHTMKNVTSALRSFLRFLHLHGQIDSKLVQAVPTVAHWRLAELPESLTEAQLDQLLHSFDQQTATGRRDYAMALCLAQLGLRAGEVADLSLDDLDWRTGRVTIQGGKSRRSAVLPLPATVGRAIVSYLRRGRPQPSVRQIFVRHQQPVGTTLTSSTVRAAIRRAFERAQLEVPSRGTHVLRHRAATHLVQSGASLKEVADVLRHRSLDTTMLYTKVDLPTLSSVALPWPEVQL